MPFFGRKKKDSPRATPQPRSISDEDSGVLADHALDSLSGLLRVYGERSFDLDGTTAEEARESFETWARHVMVGSPAHPSHRKSRVEPAPESELDSAPEAASQAEADADTARAPNQPVERDFVNLLRHVTSHRTREHGYVTQSLSDLRQVIWSIVQSLRGSMTSDRSADAVASDQLRRLASAVEGHSTEKIRREARECVRVINDLIDQRADRHLEQIAFLSEKLRAVRRELDQAALEPSRDALTGLADRSALEQHLQRIVDIGFLFAETGVLFAIEIDDFKWVSQTYDDRTANDVLRAVASCLDANFLHRNDFVARIEPSSFAAVVRIAEPEFLDSLAERVTFAIRDLEIPAGDGADGETLRVAVSMGIAELVPGESPEAWQERAQIALSKARESGGDRVCIAAGLNTPE